MDLVKLNNSYRKFREDVVRKTRMYFMKEMKAIFKQDPSLDKFELTYKWSDESVDTSLELLNYQEIMIHNPTMKSTTATAIAKIFDNIPNDCLRIAFIEEDKEEYSHSFRITRDTKVLELT